MSKAGEIGGHKAAIFRLREWVKRVTALWRGAT